MLRAFPDQSDRQIGSKSLLCRTSYPKSGDHFVGKCSKGELNLFNWDTYIGDTTLADFEKATGIHVTMNLFASDDELFAKMRAGHSGYDVIVPTDQNVTRMAGAGLLLPLDHGRIPNFANVAPGFRDPSFDRGRKYSMPYTTVVTGIGYRKSKMPGGMVPDSWQWLFDSDRFHGRIAVPAGGVYLMQLAAKYLGHSLNAIPDDMVKAIEAMLTRQVKARNIKVFHHDDGDGLLAAGEVDIVAEANGDIAQKMQDDDDIAFVVPKEGSLIDDGCLCIPADAPHAENAHRFINYILDAAAGAEIAKTILYATPNAAARMLMPASYRDNPVIFPPQSLMARCEYGDYLPPQRAQMYDDAISRVRLAV